jgi:two-component sensor histidine kinase/PAS domain-containing protein
MPASALLMNSSTEAEPFGAAAEQNSAALPAILNASGDLLLMLDKSGRIVEANAVARRVLPAAVLDARQSLANFGEPDQRERTNAALAEALSGRRGRVTWQSPTEDASVWDLSLFQVPASNGGESLVGVLGRELPTGTDAGREKERPRQIQAALERTVLALEAGEIGVWEWDFVSGSFIWDQRMRALWGLPDHATPTYELFREALNPADLERSDGALTSATNPARDGDYEVEYRVIGIKDGVERWVLAQGRAFFEDGQAVRMVGTARDVTERKQREAHVRFLMREIAHRSKNLLAVIQAMARQTAVTAGSAHDFEQIFSARLQALAASHDILMDEDWHGASIEELVRTQVGHYADLIGSRIDLAGPEMMLKPEAAQNLGLALHELSTNAAKYGGLSNEGGHVQIRWSLADGRFKISWQEVGGPAVSAPAREGFGHKVVTRIVTLALEGKVDLRFEPSGLVWGLDIPDKYVLARGSSGRG